MMYLGATAQYSPDSTLTNPFGALDTSSAITSGALLNKVYSQELRASLISDSTFYPQNMMHAYNPRCRESPLSWLCTNYDIQKRQFKVQHYLSNTNNFTPA